jgi:hypothetical protein
VALPGGLAAVFVLGIQLTRAPMDLYWFGFIECFRAWDREFVTGARNDGAVAGEKKERQEFIRDSQRLLDLYQRNEYSVLRQATPYFEKWIRLTGVYLGATDTLQADAIHLSLALFDGRQINLRFNIDHRDEIQRLREGQRINVVAQVQPVANYGNGWFAFDRAIFQSSESACSRGLQPAFGPA